jgi:hypothetical protein
MDALAKQLGTQMITRSEGLGLTLSLVGIQLGANPPVAT